MNFYYSLIMFSFASIAVFIASYLIACATDKSSLPVRLLLTSVYFLSLIIVIQQLAGTFNALRPVPVLFLAIGSSTLISFVALKKGVSTKSKNDVVTNEISLFGALSISIIVALGFANIFKNAFHLPMDFDSLFYHLPLTASMIVSESTVHNSAPLLFYPSNAELLSNWLIMPFRDDILSAFQNVIPWVMGVLSAYLLAKKFGACRDAALFSSALVAALPIVCKQISDQSTDMLLAFSWTASLYLLLEYLNYKNQKWLVPASLACGLALGTKYTGIYYFMGFFIILIFGILNKERCKKEHLKIIAICISSVLVTGGYWYCRNYFVFGSPIAPIGLDLGNIHIFDWNPSIAPYRYLERMAGTRLIDHMAEPDMFLAFVRTLAFYDPLSLALIVVAPISLFLLKRQFLNWHSGLIAFILSAAVIFVHPLITNQITGGETMTRFCLPLIVISAVFFAIVTHKGLSGPFRLATMFMATILLSAVLYGQGHILYRQGHIIIIGILLVLLIFTYYISVHPVYFKMAFICIILFSLIFITGAGQTLIDQKNKLRAGEYGRLEPNSEPTSLFQFFDKNIHDKSLMIIGSVRYPFLGPSFSNRWVQIANPELLLKGVFHQEENPDIIVITQYNMKGDFGWKLRRIDEIFATNKLKYKLIFTDHFARVYKVNKDGEI